MERYMLNEELVVTLPEGFEAMEEDAFEEAFPGHKEDAFAIHDKEKKITIGIFWNRSGFLYTKLRKPKILAGLKPQFERYYGDYELLSAIEGKVLGNDSDGLRYEYTKDDVRYCGETIVCNSRKTIYVIYYSAPKEDAESAHKLFYGILRAFRLSSVEGEFPNGYEE